MLVVVVVVVVGTTKLAYLYHLLFHYHLDRRSLNKWVQKKLNSYLIF